MKWEVRKEKAVSSLPDVGEFWWHLDGDRLFRRIADRDGMKCFPDYKMATYFFSVRDDGFVVPANRVSDDIQVLHPVAVEDGKIIFEEGRA